MDANIRHFNQFDWYGYSGASDFEEGEGSRSPLICELEFSEIRAFKTPHGPFTAEGCTVIGDKNGVGIFFCGADSEDRGVFKALDCRTPDDARREMEKALIDLKYGVLEGYEVV